MLTTEARSAPEARGVDPILREALNGILKEAPKRLVELREECKADLERLNSIGVGARADELFRGLRLACKAGGNPKVVSLALDCIQHLVQVGLLVGKGPDPFAEPGTSRCLIDAVIESICTCEEQADEGVQMRQIQVLCIAVTSQVCEVRGNSLMLAVTTLFKIYRDCKSQLNQKTAAQALNQIVNTLMQRMELSSADMSKRSISFDEASGDGARGKGGQRNGHADLHLLPPAKLLGDWMASYMAQVVDKVVKEKGCQNGKAGKFGWCVVCRSAAAHYCVETRDPVCSRACKFRNLELINLVESHYGIGGPKVDDHLPPASPQSEGAQPPADPSPAAQSPPSPPAPSPPPPDVSVSARNTEAAVATAATPPAAAAAPHHHGDEHADLLLDHGDKAVNPSHRDALLVFGYFCKMSMKDLPPAPAADQKQVRAKRISLDLILAMLEKCGPVVRSSELFIDLLKKLLCISLIKNSVSSVQKVFELSLKLFVLLITNFKEHLRTEIGVFIEQIFLRILESGNSTYHHKARVLQVFYKLCTDATTALELFLNFDCDVDEKNIFERMIDCLSKIAQGKYTSLEHANLIQPHQEQELKATALQALVTLMGSIVDWARRMTGDKGNHGMETGNEPKAEGADSDAEEDTKSESTAHGGASVPVWGAAPAHNAQSSIMEQKQRKLELQIGVHKFNMKPKRGIEYLKQNGFIKDDPKDVAEFFCKGDLGLDKTAIGDYLGEDKPFNKAILYALVESQDFAGQDLDASLRQFLSIFRLPGEAQKIDRMMEKFAEKWCNDNPGTFANADCAFVLSFSLIMLQTDLHNPGVKNKMTKDEFVRNNRGINDKQDLPRDYLERLYEGVLNNPISLKEDEDARNRLDSQAAQSERQKYDLFVRETESMVLKSQEMMKEKVRKEKSSTYVAAQNVEHVRPLFEVACWPYLATLAVLLEMSDDSSQAGVQTVQQCIEGFKQCIRIASRFDMDTERDAFVSSLAKFTYLTTVKEMKQKNIECIKALLNIGFSEGNNLGPAWQYVLYCISQLERLQLIGSHSKQDHMFFSVEDEHAMSPGQGPRPPGGGSQSAQVTKRRAHGLGVSALVSLGADDRQVEQLNSDAIVSQIDSAQIELLFNRSTWLNRHAIVHFVRELAKVSKEELHLADQPRIFSMQKLVEVADYNMRRSRLDWQNVWRVLSQHFIEVAAHPNVQISFYAIDSLRQLAKKFLDKDELSNYNFQADFLNPFEVVMVSTPGVTSATKEYVVEIIKNTVESKMQTIKSGWKTVFHIFRAAAHENHEANIERIKEKYASDPRRANEEAAKALKAAQATVESAFRCVELVIEQRYEVVVENFNDGIQALLAFGQSRLNAQMSLRAIRHLLQAAEYLAAPPPDPAVAEAASSSPTAGTSTAGPASRHPAEHWLHILRGLSALVSDPRREVRAEALNGLFDCLTKHGGNVFDEDTWRMVFNGVIKPLFDDIHHQLQPDQRKQDGTADDQPKQGTAASWAAHMGPPTCLQALTALVRLFEAQLDSLAFLLDDVLKLIEGCINHSTEAVARIGIEGLKQLLLLTGRNMKPDAWQKVTATILQLFNGSMPTKLMCVEVSASGEGQLPFRKDEVVIQCVVQLLLIDMLSETLSQHYEHIPPTGIMTILDALQRSFEFAQEFNQQIELRQTLKRLGFIRELKQLPGLLKQEREALSCSLKVLFQVQRDPRMQEGELAAPAAQRLMHLCKTTLRNFVSKERLVQEHADAPAPENPAADPHAGDREAAINEVEREVLGLVPIVSEVVLGGLRKLRPDQFAKHAPELFPLLCDLTVVNSREVRERVRDVLAELVAPIVVGAAQPEF